MNKTLFDSFKKLSDTERADLKNTFRDSPVGLRLIDFLESLGNRAFKNRDAVAFVYRDDKAGFSVLENRYFKLRKKLLDAIRDSAPSDSEQLLTEEEQQLFRCRNGNSAENREQVYRQLTALEKSCWEKNIFELLPAVLDQLLFCNQSINRIERNQPFYERLEKAIVLQHDMNRCMMLARRIYEINFTKGIKFAKKELAAMKDLATKHKSFPRFLMCYHHVSLYYKLGSRDYLDDLQVVSRHLAEFKKLHAKYPGVPLISYKANYIKMQHFHFANISMFYHFNRCEFREAHEAMTESWNLVLGKDPSFRIYKTESLYYNMFTSQCMAGFYKEANETCDLYLAFLKENHQLEKMSFAYTLKARVFVNAYPETLPLDPAFLMEQLNQYIRILKKDGNVQASMDDTLLIKAKLHFISGEPGKALKVLKEPVLKAYLETLKGYSLMNDLGAVMQNVDRSGQGLNGLIKSADQLFHNAKTPEEYIVAGWLRKFARHYQKQHAG